jgi:hypothetical protein
MNEVGVLQEAIVAGPDAVTKKTSFLDKKTPTVVI